MGVQALKVADLGHTATPVSQHIRWVKRLQEEFFAQVNHMRSMRSIKVARKDAPSRTLASTIEIVHNLRDNKALVVFSIRFVRTHPRAPGKYEGRHATIALYCLVTFSCGAVAPQLQCIASSGLLRYVKIDNLKFF